MHGIIERHHTNDAGDVQIISSRPHGAYDTYNVLIELNDLQSLNLVETQDWDLAFRIYAGAVIFLTSYNGALND